MAPIALSSGDLSLKITPNFLDEKLSQKLDDEAFYDKDLNLVSSNGKNTSVASVVKALQKMGVSSKSMVSIIQALKQSGAISADLEVL